MVLVNKFVLIPGTTSPQLYQVKGSPLNGWFLCIQVNDKEVQASILYRLEDFDKVGALFFDHKPDAEKAMEGVGQQTLSEAIHAAKKRPQ